ncbi:tRNA(Met) cytidine acetyltransferase TmcA [Marinobacter xestospongiae]|uniref:tRNA(Met) cytidine acetyltransferase TmcA n=1 Tax=Marinobacter xestospongiae TaxID=994319 RepID=A0ABU3VXG4_9GAMM|nr:GNAT family N-acetyltransferase [Marinobacter xestospongiae]MDV2078830.1 GNAT family N-acetyltransferase [Marinobacter xestospongiae]
MSAWPSPDLPAWQRFQQRLRNLGQRRLVLLEGDRDAAMAWLRQLLPGLDGEPRLWLGPQAAAGELDLTPVRPARARDWLGRDVALLVWDGWNGNPPDALAALSGTLAAGGLWFWLMPPCEGWGRFADPDYPRTGLDSAADHPFAARLATLVANDAEVLRIGPGCSAMTPPQLPVSEAPFCPGATSEQSELVADVIRVGLGRRRRPLVVSADRGRGKSAALGMAAMALLQQGRRRVLVTAPRAEAVATLFHHARQATEQTPAVAAADHLRLADGAELLFLPPDRLLAERPEAELVLVDEAAAIPAPQLRAILLGWPRCVFSTTIHGYEGTGRGFNIRFRGVLERETPQWRQRQLSAPIRWCPDDPLERLVDQLFLLQASGPDAVLMDEAVRVERWSPADASEHERQQAFGLLVDAHYRTSPGDLRQWLDDPTAVSWRAWLGGRLVGVLWAAREGGLSCQLAEEVMAGRRRLRGHLLPQSLANHSGFAEAATCTLLRVVRIAVSAGCRRSGVGQALVAAAREYSEQAGLDALGTSYGASPDLLAFWQRCGLRTVRLGLHREASSGEFTVQMLSGLSADGQALVEAIAARFSQHWLTLLPVVWPQLAPELTLAVTAQLPPAPVLSALDRRELAAFAEGHRGLELALPVLRLLSARPDVATSLRHHDDAGLWCRLVLQGWSPAQAQSAGLCHGRRDAEQRLRAVTRQFLPHSERL